MEIGIIGTGFIGGVLGNALADAGHVVRFGSRHPGDDEVVDGPDAVIVSVHDALEDADIVILAVPGPSVVDLVAEHGDLLSGHLVIDATNRIGTAVTNCRADLPANVRYARAFNSLSGEVMAQPRFAEGAADLYFSAPVADRAVVELAIEGVGLRPVFVGSDREDLVDGVFRLWVALAAEHGRRHAFHLMED